ncbi:hypothetical protein WOLCODRAFT_107140 [Wolfiporia cocos MD-104 SS10]|uniref:Uncharacterized protein n=1 Tax=Wolfiporia cocos (strain MD-104) TaxID=742152 RepID=A0A2H3J8Y9_WOLCO|nr:hypothetical protein WOLCODRAFT_107140 [Wolfiporia cocos MD-104 SS10]
MAPPQLLRSARAAPVPPSRSPSPNALAISTDDPMERAPSAASRAHPPSPVGPRPQKPRPVSAIHISANPRNMQSALAPFAAPQTAHQFVPMATGRMTPQQAPAPMTPVAALGSPAPVQAQSMFTPPLHRGLPVHPVRRGSAPLPAPVPGAGAQAVPPGVPVPGRAAYRSSMFAPQSAVIHAPVPVQASTNVNPILPMITAPRVPDAEMQRTFDQYANMLNMQAASWNATRGSAQPPVAQDSRAERMEICEESRAEPFAIVDLGAPVQTRGDADARRNTAANADKENLDGGARPHRRAHTHNEHGQGGLGFGHSVPMARELGNMVFFNDSANKEPVKEKRDRRSRPPALDLHGTPLLHKRSTFSMIGSPGPMSPPSSVIGSPVVGEFKGWFSNLFHWRVQSYLLYSVLDVFTTRNETERLLGRFGIVSALEENDGWHVLKCRTDDSPMQDGPAVMQKQVRFRIEFSALNGAPPSASQTPRLAQNPLSPQTNSFVGPRRRNDRANDFQCVIGLVLEKGSVSIFKTIYQRLRTEWRLDALQSPRMSVTTAATPSMEQRFVA